MATQRSTSSAVAMACQAFIGQLARDLFTSIKNKVTQHRTAFSAMALCVFPLLSFIFLAFASSPVTYMFETDFENINNLSIEGFQGVTKISVSFSLFSSLTKKLTTYASSGVSGKDTWSCTTSNILN